MITFKRHNSAKLR